MSRHSKLALWLLLTIIIWIAAFASFFKIAISIESRTIMLSVVVVSLSSVGLISLYIWIRDRATYVETISTQLKEYKRIVEEKSYTFHIIDSKKEIKILNEDGDATVSFYLRCENTSDKTLNHININITHDGNLEDDSLHCMINGREVKPIDIEQLVTLYLKTKKEIKTMPYTLTFKIPAEGGIRSDEKFEYGYSYTARKLFPKVTEENKEYSSTLILHPTSRITVTVEAPDDHVFLDKGRIEVFDRDKHEHVKEEKRIISDSPPILISNGKILLWTGANPLLATTYRLYFTIRRTSS